MDFFKEEETTKIIREDMNDFDDNGFLKEVDLREVLMKTDNNIRRYEAFVDHLWEQVIIKYKMNPHYGMLLDKLDEYNPEKFYNLMYNQESYKKLVKSKKKIESMLKEGIITISYIE